MHEAGSRQGRLPAAGPAPTTAVDPAPDLLAPNDLADAPEDRVRPDGTRAQGTLRDEDPEDDETLAARARARYRLEAMPALAPDEAIAGELAPGERVHTVHRGVALDRRQPTAGRSPIGLRGDLYLTCSRLVLVGRPPVVIPLDAIREVGLAGERLLLVMADGSCTVLDVDRPRLLRVEIGAARAAARPGAPGTGQSPSP